MTGDTAYMHIAARDITRRRKVEEALCQSSLHLDRVNDTIIVVNARKEIIRVNKEFSRLWTYSPEDVLGKSVFMLFPEQEISKHAAEMAKAIATGEPGDFEMVALAQSGREVPLTAPLKQSQTETRLQTL